MAQDSVIVDTRTEVAFSASHVPGSLSIWLSGIPAFAGWFLPYDRPILLVNETDNPDQVVRYLARLGYKNIAGFLAGGMLAWQVAGNESATIRTVTVHEFCSVIDQKGLPWLLDIRSASELDHTGRLIGAYHIHLTELQERMDEVPKDRPVYIFCASGLRSMVAASFLKRAGWEDLIVVLGGLTGWKSVSCPVRK
jgi:hydroxyacylglutathione hydrolase